MSGALDPWLWCDPLTLHEAAPLQLGTPPDGEPLVLPAGYTPAMEAMKRAVESGELPAKVDPDWSSSYTARRADIAAWLSTRGVRTGHFFPSGTDDSVAGLLDPKHPRYAPKLAAAVSAWQAVSDSGRQHPKQAIEEWLSLEQRAIRRPYTEWH